jgi:hypothetical protein
MSDGPGSLEADDLRMSLVAINAAEVIKRLLAIPLADLEDFARHAREHAERIETLTPILAHRYSLGEISKGSEASRASARAASALVAARRVIEEVKAP